MDGVAPLLPLVLQHVEALHEFVDIPQGTAVNIIVGLYVWFEDPDVASVDGEVERISNGKADIERTDGKKVVRLLSPIYPKDVEAQAAAGVDDMTKLSYLHKLGLLQNLKTRYEINEVYGRYCIDCLYYV
ncbi:hypothetical protein P3S67_014581 [Capsicum chacoense]